MKNIKKASLLIYNRWFSLALCYITLYLSTHSYRQERFIFTLAAITVVLIKLTGLVLNHRHLRTIGIIGINVIWALTVLDFVQMGQPFYFSLFTLIIGVGISLKGRFDG